MRPWTSLMLRIAWPRAIRRRRRNSEESPVSGPRWRPTRNSRVSHRWFALQRSLSCARHADPDWHRLARSSNQVSSSARKFKKRRVPRVPVLRLGPPPAYLVGEPQLIIPLILGCANFFALRWLTTPPIKLCRNKSPQKHRGELLTSNLNCPLGVVRALCSPIR